MWNLFNKLPIQSNWKLGKKRNRPKIAKGKNRTVPKLPNQGGKIMEENLVTLTIDGVEVKAKKGTTILEAAKEAGIDIPTLCFLKDINEMGDCRMCIVEVEGRRGFATSCIQTVEEGMVVHTHTPNVLEARHVVLDLIISNHAKDCLTCTRSGNCELQALAVKFNVLNVEFPGEMSKHKIDDLSPSIVRDFNKCILCRRCVAACKKVQKIDRKSTRLNSSH